MEPDKIILSILLFGAFIVGSMYFMFGENNNGFLSNYSDVMDVKVSNTRLNAIKNTSDKVYDIAKEQKDDLKNESEFEDSSGTPLYKVGWRALYRMPRYFGLVGTLVGNISLIFNLPKWVTSFVVVAIGIIVTFTLVYIIMRFQPRSD